MNQKTAGPEGGGKGKMKTAKHYLEDLGKARAERGLKVSLWTCGSRAWRATIIYLCIRRSPRLNRGGGGDARAISEGVLVGGLKV